MISRLLFLTGLFAFNTLLFGQSIKHPDLSDYNEEQKRLLVISTGKFIYVNSQGQIDLDSSILLSCHIYGLSRMLPYDEDYFNAGLSAYISQLDSGDFLAVESGLKKLKENEQLPLYLLLGSYYLFRSGDEQKDLLKTLQYVSAADRLSSKLNSPYYRRASNLLSAKYFAKTKNIKESQNKFLLAEEQDKNENNRAGLARDYLYHGDCLPYNNPEKIVYLNKSMDLFQQLNDKEKQIETLSDIIGADIIIDFELAKKQLYQLLDIQKQNKFRHVQFTYSVLAFLYVSQENNTKALALTEKSLQTMKETGDTFLIAVPYQLMGNIYGQLSLGEKALTYLRKSFESKDPATMLFWGKSFLSAAQMLAYNHRETESLTLIKEVTAASPPVTTFDKMAVAYLKGNCYDRLGNIDLANRYYSEFAVLADQIQPEYVRNEIPGFYYHLARFYFKQGNLNKAKIFLGKAKRFAVLEAMSVDNLDLLYQTQFLIDSAENNTNAALNDHIKYKYYDDSVQSLAAIKHMNELSVQYQTEKKDNNILLLTREASLQKAELRRSEITRNLIIGAAILLLLIAALTYNLYKNKKKASEEIAIKNATLEELVKEKEWLVQEIHHRVKNNLHTVIGLLESQSVFLQNDALQAIRDSQHRIFAMSLTHQKLYQSSDLTTIDMLTYLSELIIYLRESFETKNNIVFDMQIDPVELDVSQAVPLGLILNEALTNSLKYAFPDSRKGTIRISMKMNPNQQEVNLVIEDNGIGLPVHFGSASATTLGMKLMKGLSKEIHATFDIQSNGNGTSIGIRFRKMNISRLNAFSA